MSNRAERRKQQKNPALGVHGWQQNPIQASRLSPQVRNAGLTNKRKEKKGRTR